MLSGEYVCCPAQVKNKGARRITFEQFLTALSKLAERKVGTKSLLHLVKLKHGHALQEITIIVV